MVIENQFFTMSIVTKIKPAKTRIKKILDRHKNNKFLYYVRSFSSYVLPAKFFRARLNRKLAAIKDYDINDIKKRVNYYNLLTGKHELKNSAVKLCNLKLGKKDTTYFFDTYEYTRYFNDQLKANFIFGDVIDVPDEPTILKSRPVRGNNANSVLLNLNKVRHFIFTNDRKEFGKKKDMLVWRGGVYQPHRIRFMEMYFNHPLCNIGQINTGQNQHWVMERLTIGEHLDYKFVLCLEGNDVASNLKWVMSSNSIAVMPKPSYETWFMEGTLVPDFHYILIKDDYSDLEEKLHYYTRNTEAALQIIKNANQHIEQFKDKKREDLISLLVLQKYFYKTGQIEISDDRLLQVFN
jgi:hypothetical protein